MRRVHVAGIVFCASIGMLLSGCSSNGSAQSDAAASGGAATAPAPTTPKEQLLLDQAAFPAGAQHQPITPEMLKSQADKVVDTTQSAQVTPAQCGAHQVDLKKALANAVDDVAATTYIADGHMYLEMIFGHPLNLDQVKTAISGPCANVTMKMSLGGQQAETKSTSTAVALPGGVDPAHAYAYRQVVTTELGPQGPTQSASLLGYAQVRGMTVAMNEVNLGGGTTDQAEFDKLFTAAVQKVEQAK
ncbi:hypothetical protein [Speluncibacter jeojiensis]|uniref:DUF5642 domain-containing protein n=1 Tax=Speluncibacter jeojiensis TaxID=2710754 RepID=A0A9X4M3B2_9ACTN|nr:hypothetical protein [Corynebacteriales bacterium D3-21]